MKDLYELRDKLCDELREYSKKEISANSLDVVDKLARTIKNLDKIIEFYDGGYSGDYVADPPYRNSRRNMNSDESGVGRSYRRGRDSMGRYVSRDDGYSYGADMMSELRKMMEEAPDERVRQEFKRFISKMETV